MRVFLSYASEDRNEAERLCLALRQARFDVFFDRDDVKEGEEFDSLIQDEISRCDLFVFLVSEHSLADRSYALSELKFARDRWPAPSGRVLPVLLRGTDAEALPPYLRAVAVLSPAGDLAAEASAEVKRLAKEIRRRWFNKALMGTVGLLILVSMVLIWHATRGGLQAKIQVDSTSAPLGHVFQFEDQSTPVPDRREWVFDDKGEEGVDERLTADDERPSHKYKEPGSYTVSLIVYRDGKESSDSIEITVLPGPELAEARFEPEVTEIFEGESVQFRDRSSPSGDIGTWTWDFGNGESREQNPRHLFDRAGAYTVTLVISDREGNSDTSEPQVITVIKPVSASYEYEPDGALVAPVRVTFRDRSEGPITRRQWHRNPSVAGDWSSPNPSIEFTRAGNYHVELSIEGEAPAGMPNADTDPKTLTVMARVPTLRGQTHQHATELLIGVGLSIAQTHTLTAVEFNRWLDDEFQRQGGAQAGDSRQRILDEKRQLREDWVGRVTWQSKEPEEVVAPDTQVDVRLAPSE